MADNLTTQTTVATVPSGSVIATDDVAGVHYQRVKLVDGTADGTAAIAGDAANGLDVDVTRVQGTVTVSGTVTANAGTGPFPVSDNGGSLTVDAASLPLPTGASTLAEQQSQTTALQLIDDAVHADDAVRGKSLLIGAVLDDTTPTAVTENQAGYLRMSSARRLLVDPSGVTSPISATSLPLPTGAATAALQTQPGVDIGDVTVNNASGAAAVNIQDGGNSITVDGTVTANAGTGTFTVANGGTFAVQDSEKVADNAAFTDGATKVQPAGYIYDEVAGTALTENDVAAGRINVNRAQVAAIEDGATRGRYATVTAANAVKIDGSAVTQPVSGTVTVTQATATNLKVEAVGPAAHDAAASGNPLLNAGSHETIADSAPTNRLATVTDGDVQRLSTTDGALFVIPSGPQQWKARLTGLIAADTTVKAAPGAGLSLYVTDIVFSIGAATASSIMLEESTTTPVFGPHYLEAVAGRGLAVHFGTPLKIAANTLLSATGTGSTTATLDVTGFTAPG